MRPGIPLLGPPYLTAAIFPLSPAQAADRAHHSCVSPRTPAPNERSRPPTVPRPLRPSLNRCPPAVRCAPKGTPRPIIPLQLTAPILARSPQGPRTLRSPPACRRLLPASPARHSLNEQSLPKRRPPEGVREVTLLAILPPWQRAGGSLGPPCLARAGWGGAVGSRHLWWGQGGGFQACWA